MTTMPTMMPPFSRTAFLAVRPCASRVPQLTQCLERNARAKLYTLDEGSDEEGDGGEDRKKKPAKERSRSMRVNEIEGQEDASAEQFDEGGVAIEPFNMREEFQLGDMDESGTYTLKKDAHEANDAWLSSITGDDIRKAQAAQAARQQRADAADADSAAEKTTEEHLAAIIAILRPGESPLRAIKRLAGDRPSAAQRWNKKAKAKEEVSSADTQTDEMKRQFAAVSDSAARLLAGGYTDIYTETKEALETDLRRRAPQTDGVTWQYKWSADAEETFGPFSTAQMMQWEEAVRDLALCSARSYRSC